MRHKIKKIFFLFFIIFLNLVFISDSNAFLGDKEEVVDAFNAYMKAALKNDGGKVVSLISQKTFDVYERFRKLAWNGSPQDLAGLNPYEKFTVLHLRHRLSKEELGRMTSRQILQKTYEQGWNSKKALELVGNLGISLKREVKILGDRATLELKLGEKFMPPPFPMKKENNGWKLDMVAMFPYLNEKLEKHISAQGKPADEVISEMLKSIHQNP